MNRWEVLLGIVNVTVLFMPIVLVFWGADRTRTQREAARERRIAEYRKSPYSRLLILND